MTKYSENALAIYKKLYFAAGETTPEQVHERVANFIGNNKKEKEQFKYILDEQIFRPNTPVLINAGLKGKNDWDKQLCACHVLGLEDSMESIIDMWSTSSKIFASGAGIGIPITNLREKGAIISGGGTASGALAYLDVIEQVAKTVRSGGRARRSAIMGTYNYNHPEAMDITKSKTNGDKLSSFNLSMLVDDLFMESVLNKSGQCTMVSPKYGVLKDNTINVMDIWNEVIEQSWLTGDPGLLFFDTTNKYNPFPSYGKIESTNPCVTGDTLILTNKGYIEIQNLVDQEVSIWNGYEWSKVTPKVTGENEKIIKIKFSDGNYLKCTLYHKFYLANGTIKKAKDLNINDKLIKWDFPKIITGEYFPIAYTQGFFAGDGTYKRDRPFIWLYNKKKKILSYLNYISSNENNGRIDVTLDETLMYDKDFVPIDNSWDQKAKLEFLSGLIDSDGNSTEDGCIQISSVNKTFLRKVKLMLNTLGTNGSMSQSHERKKKYLPTNKGDGTYKLYNCKKCYRLNISANHVVNLLRQGLNTHRVKLNKNNPNREASRFIYIKEIINNNQQVPKVYCFTEPKKGTGIFNGILTGQCGEVPLPAWSVCCLGSINLNKILTEDNTIDWKKFEEYIKLSVRFLDNVIDKTTYLHPAFKETMIKTRPIGLGIMGFSDILFKIGIGYNTEEARELFANICKKLTHIAINESIDLVTIDAENTIDIPKKDRVHFKKLLKHYTNSNTSILEDFENWGIRNSTWTCIAPTGSISISADCSYAFEPCFALAFDKQIAETGEIMTFVNPIFEQELEKFIDTLDIDYDLKRQAKNRILKEVKQNKGSCQNCNDLPKQIREIFVTAHDISPMDKLEMQATGQKYISLGISSTCNLPKSATKEDVSDIFIKAWQLGLKGITVYRDGCKEDQPIHFGEKECKEFKISPERYAILEAEFNRQKALEKEPIIQMYKAESKEQLKREEKFIHGKMQRPIKRIGETCEVNTPHGRLFITGNRDESGRLFETFLRIGKQGSLNNLLIDALSRCMSKALQSGLTLDVFTDTLRGNKEIPFRFKLDENQEELFYAESLVDAIGIVFQEVFLKETTKSETGQILKQCPSCGKWGVDPSGCTRGGICIYCNYSNCS